MAGTGGVGAPSAALQDATLAELAVRVARAELERDQAREREMEAKASERRAWDAYGALVSGDKEKMLDTLTIIGIPARDLADIYEIEQVWRQEGGDASLLEWWRSARAVGRASLGSSSGGETDGN